MHILLYQYQASRGITAAAAVSVPTTVPFGYNSRVLESLPCDHRPNDGTELMPEHQWCNDILNDALWGAG